MSSQLRGLIQILALILFVLLLIYFFPVVARIAEVSALRIRQFWWAVLIIALGLWLIWVLRKRNSG